MVSRGDKMNKKGFTLIEIIAVIVIIGLLIVLVTPNILANLSGARGDVSDVTRTVIEEAADLYLDKYPEIFDDEVGSTICITVETLINDGLLVEPLIDAETGNEIPGTVAVRVTMTDDGRVKELIEDGTCNDGSGDASILTSDDIKLTIGDITTKGFTPRTTIERTDVPAIIKYDYSIDGGKTYEYQNKGTSPRITNLVTGTYKVRVKVTTEDGQVVVSEVKEAILKELTYPTFSSNPSMNVCASPKTVTVTNELTSATANAVTPKDTLSYSYTLDPSVSKSSWKTKTVDGNGKYTVNVTENGTMVARITDGVNEKVASYALTRVATPNPVVLSATVDYAGEPYYAGKITVKGRVSVCKAADNSGLVVDSYCLTTTNSKPSATSSCWTETDGRGTTNAEKGTFGRDNGTYYAWVKDSDGLVSEKGYQVVVNWTGTPSCSINTSGTMGNNSWYRSNVSVSLSVDTKGKTERSRSLSHSSITANGTTNITGSVAAGGKSSNCSKSVKKDTANPSCSVSSYSSGNSNPWVRFACSDSHSGCTASSATKYASSSTTLSYTCTDNAGNTSGASRYVTYVQPDSFSYGCICQPTYTVHQGRVGISIGSSTGPSSISYYCGSYATSGNSCRYDRTTGASVTRTFKAIKGNFSRTCSCTSPRYCRKTTKTCYWTSSSGLANGGLCSSSQEGSTVNRGSTANYTCRCSTSTSDAEC